MKKNDPTPYLNKIRSERGFFTYSENKLLDQITTEIMEAWSKDLKTIKSTHEKSIKLYDSIKSVHEILEEKFPKLAEFIQNNEFIENFNNVNKNMDSINLRLGEINQYIFQLNEKINFSYVKSLMDTMKGMEKNIVDLKNQVEKLNNKKWWKRFLFSKPKI